MKVVAWFALAVALLQFVHYGLPPGNADLISVQMLAMDLAHHEDRFLYPGFAFMQNDAWVAHHEANLRTVSAKRIEPNWCFYPPLVPFLFIPFAKADVETWRVAWGVLQLALIALFAELILRLLRRTGASAAPNRILIYALVFGCFPVALSEKLGQTSVLVALFLWGGVYARLSDGKILAALGIGSAVFIKPFLALIEIVDLARRKVWFALSVAGVTLSLLLISLLATGLHAQVEYWNLLSTLASSQNAFNGNQSLLATIMRFFSDLSVGDYGFRYDPVVALYGRMLAAAVVGVAGYAQWKSGAQNVLASTGLWISAGLLALPISWDHHLLFLLPVIAYLWTRRWTRTGYGLLGAATALICVFAHPFYGESISGKVAASLPMLGDLILFVFLVTLHVRPRAFERVHV